MKTGSHRPQKNTKPPELDKLMLYPTPKEYDMDINQELGVQCIHDPLVAPKKEEPPTTPATPGSKMPPSYSPVQVRIPLFNLDAGLGISATPDSQLLGMQLCAPHVTEQENNLLSMLPGSPMNNSAIGFSHTPGGKCLWQWIETKLPRPQPNVGWLTYRIR